MPRIQQSDARSRTAKRTRRKKATNTRQSEVAAAQREVTAAQGHVRDTGTAQARAALKRAEATLAIRKRARDRQADSQRRNPVR